LSNYSASQYKDNLRVEYLGVAVATAHKAHLELVEIEEAAKAQTAESLAAAKLIVKEQVDMAKVSARLETPEERLMATLREMVSGIVFEAMAEL
jgi:hypothetical protein